MSKIVTVNLRSAASDMAQEEIQKQLAFLHHGIRDIKFTADGTGIDFSVPNDVPDSLIATAGALAERVQRSLRSLERKVVYRSERMGETAVIGEAAYEGVRQLGPGQMALQGLPLRLFSYFDRVFREFGARWKPQPLLTPTLIPAETLARCDYFRSFPHNVTFATHLVENAATIQDFRGRHQERSDLDDQALADMTTPEACLSPAVCYHVYHLHENDVIPAQGRCYEICGKCFRYEASNMTGLRRLWDFTMREVVFLGGRDQVLALREESIRHMSELIEEHELAMEIRTASDPFFVAPDATAKTYFQLSSETKYEMSLVLSKGDRLAVGSHNYHTDFFGRAFNTCLESGGYMHSVCVAFGLERWVHGFLAQHGTDSGHWPATMRAAPEFAGLQ